MKKTGIFFLTLATLLIAAAAQAAIQQVHIVGVGVDRSSTAAEAKALDYAKKRAVYLTALKLDVEHASDKVAALKPEDYDRIIRGATVIRSQRKDMVTYAEVSVSVIDTELKRALGMPATEAQSAEDGPILTRGVLVLPVYVEDAHPYLWEKDNALRDPLSAEVLRQAHGAVMMPAGDYEDLRLVDYGNVLEVTAEELKPMFERYGADEIVIAIVTPGADHTEEPTKVILRRLSLKGTKNEAITINPPSADESRQARLEAAAGQIASALVEMASSTAAEELQQLKSAGKQAVTFHYASPRELGTLEESVRAAPGVIQLEIPSISLQNVAGTIYYTGSEQALHDALVAKGIVVGNQAKGGWTLSVR